VHCAVGVNLRKVGRKLGEDTRTNPEVKALSYRYTEFVKFPRVQPSSRRDRLWREWCFVRAVARKMRWRLVILLSIVTLGTLVFKLTIPPSERPMTIPEAIFETWFLLFGNPSAPLAQNTLARVVTVLLPMLGLAGVVDAVVDLAFLIRDRRATEHSWCKIMTHSMTGHIVIVGFGKIGYRTYSILKGLGERIAILEINEKKQYLAIARKHGDPVFVGDARHDHILADTNIKQAKAIILATEDDMTNLEVALDARKVNPNIRVVLRMFDQDIADKVAGAAGIRIALSQSAISAPAFATAAITEGVVGSCLLGDQLIITRRLKLSADHPFAGKTVGSAVKSFAVGIVQRRDGAGGTQLFPPPETPLLPGDVLLVQGLHEVVAAMPT
jgi:voltage-gated potassium channel